MDPAQQALWRQADQVLDQLLDLPRAEQDAALEAMALAPELLGMVQRLLQAHQTSGVLDSGLQMPALPEPAPDLSGRVLGRWQLQAPIGEGGMAVVYRAVSITPPLDQVAAVKILTLGSLVRDPGGQALLREQQLLARLQHPFIAPFHDAGICADGTPWLAMGIVDGLRIDQWCERQQADLDTRIGLVLEVADALAYAHRNLVLHRDIKPSNVLVDGDGHVRLLDFGIGHLLDHATERTATLLRALTPDYAAPEQFQDHAPSTAVDVYGLGALLYRLLTGHPPHGSNSDRSHTQSPSRRLLQDPSVAPAQRRRLSRPLRGDLDTIVMKALASDARDRYPSIDAMADDLRRWRSRRPISARRPSLRYQLGLLMRRHRLAATAVIALLLVLAAGVASTLWQARRAAAHAALAEAAAERSRAQLAYLDALLEELVAPTSSSAPRRATDALIQVAADRAAKELARQPDVLAGVESSLASVAQRAGYQPLALTLADSAHRRLQALEGADVQALALAKVALAELLRQADPADPQRARQLAEAAGDMLRTHPVQGAARVAALRELAIQYTDDDEVDAATALLEQAGGLCRTLPADEPACDQLLLTHGSLLYRIGRYQQADVPLRQVVEARRQRVGDDHVLSFSAQQLLAMNTLRAGDPPQALAMLERLLELQRAAYPQPTRETLRTLQALGEAHQANHDLPAARQLAAQVLEETRVVTGEDSPELALAYSQIAGAAFADGDYRQAEQAYAESRRRYRQIHGDDSLAYSIVTGNQADALRELGELERSLALHHQSLAIAEQAVHSQPLRLAARLSNYARTLTVAGRASEALPAFERSIALYRQAAPDAHHYLVVEAYRSAALLALGQTGPARQLASDARAGLEKALGKEDRYTVEALAMELTAHCTAPASPACPQLAGDARAALQYPSLQGKPRQMLRKALSGHRPG